MESYLLDHALQRQAELHKQARRDALVKQAMQSNQNNSFRNMVGMSLVKLGERLVQQPKPSKA